MICFDNIPSTKKNTNNVYKIKTKKKMKKKKKTTYEHIYYV